MIETKIGIPHNWAVVWIKNILTYNFFARYTPAFYDRKLSADIKQSKFIHLSTILSRCRKAYNSLRGR